MVATCWRAGAVITNQAVEAIDANGVVVAGRRIDAGTVIWGAGIKASPVSGWLGATLDRASRVLVPRKLREHAGIGEDAILVGMYDRLEIWGSETWVAHLSELEEEHEMSLGKVLSMPSIKPSFPGAETLP